MVSTRVGAQGVHLSMHVLLDLEIFTKGQARTRPTRYNKNVNCIHTSVLWYQNVWGVVVIWARTKKQATNHFSQYGQTGFYGRFPLLNTYMKFCRSYSLYISICFRFTFQYTDNTLHLTNTIVAVPRPKTKNSVFGRLGAETLTEAGRVTVTGLGNVARNKSAAQVCIEP